MKTLILALALCTFASMAAAQNSSPVAPPPQTLCPGDNAAEGTGIRLAGQFPHYVCCGWDENKHCNHMCCDNCN